MNKPDWKDAPPWADWLAMDSDKQWYWHAYEPQLDKSVEMWHSRGRAEVIRYDTSYYAIDTLEQRQ